MKRSSKSLTLNLKHQITFFENKTVNPVDLDNWQEKLKTFAEITPVSESNFSMLEGLNFGHMITEAYFIFRIRFIDNVNAKQKIVFKDRNFDIKRIININEQNRVLMVIALEV
jgi:SPP1 family predicted phage head-tail adaptor